MNRRKIVVVAFHLGRVGSSALMGLLNIAGLNPGKKDHLTGPGKMNPKGFFELKPQQVFLEKAYPEYYPVVTDPPSLEYLEEKGRQFYESYHRLLQEEFKNGFPAAVKSQRMLTLPFFFYLHQHYQHYDIRILVIDRNLQHQVDSTRRIWQKSSNALQKEASQEFVRQYIVKWREFSHRVEDVYRKVFPFFHLSFEQLMKDSVKTTRDVFDFIEEPEPPANQINQWLDPSLVNRSSF